ncbi:MAG: hypothetical protein AAF483_27510 [Planctomycetota bacterium]
MSKALTLPQDLTEDQRQWIHWRMDWLCEEFSEALLQNAKVALLNGSQFPAIFRTSQGAKEDQKLAQQYLQQLSTWMDFDSSNFTLCFDESEANDDSYAIQLSSAELQDRQRLLALLAHEIGYAQVTGERGNESAEDIEGLADLAAVFFGLGVLMAAASQTQQNDRQFQTSLSPAMLGYSLALFAEIRGESKPAWAAELNGQVLEAFYDSQYYLEQTTEEIASDDRDEMGSHETVALEPQAELPAPKSDNSYSEPPSARDTVEQLDERDDSAHEDDSYSLNRKCKECGRLTEPGEQLCTECEAANVDHRAALREELAKHDDNTWIVHFGLLVTVVLIILIAVAAVSTW